VSPLCQNKYPDLDVKTHKKAIDELTVRIFSVRLHPFDLYLRCQPLNEVS
jgi:hypothetical protein